ncbi:hypothetical protein [Shouchella miscanthi]|uniref:Uncharacterized protein n=1 Tax=Shouchella miscanthi TaxID=2598861 RepID=A0ABU6NJ65_9BACI|nr:hypothetical protein [Shouchella miscanthi]
MNKAMSLLIAAVAIIGLAACNSTDNETQANYDSNETAPNEPAEVEEVDTEEEEAEENVGSEVESYLTMQELLLGNPDLYPVTELSGNGSGSEVFNISIEGYTLFEFENMDSDSNFIVRLESVETGEETSSLVNEIGDYEGIAGMKLAEGDYIMQVSSDGVWSSKIHPAFTTDIDESKSWEGVGDSVIGPIVLEEGIYELTFAHEGESNFISRTYDVLGNDMGSIVNEIGNHEGNHITTAYDGEMIFIGVAADGNWTFDLTQ